MDIMLEQGDTMDGLDEKLILRNFDDAYNTMKAIASIYRARKFPRNIALLVAFVHPEVMRDPAVANMVNRIDEKTGQVTRLGNDIELIRAYIGDGTRPNKRFADLLEDIRIGTIYTSLEGQRRGEAETSESSARSVQKFMTAADRMAKEIDNNPRLTCQAKLSPLTGNMNATVAAQANIIYRAADWNMLFGYSQQTVPGSSPEQRAKEWERLRILEHWFVEEISREGGGTEDRSDAPNAVYAVASKLVDFLDKNPDVVDVIGELNRFYGDSYDNDVIKQVSSKIVVSHESSVGQMAALLVMKPAMATTAFNALKGAHPEKAAEYDGVMAKIDEFRASAATNLSVSMGNWKSSVITKQIADKGETNPESIELSAMLSNTENSPAVTWFRKTIDPEFANGKNTDFGNIKMLGALVDHPGMLGGLVDDPADIPDDIGLKAGGAPAEGAETADDTQDVDTQENGEVVNGRLVTDADNDARLKRVAAATDTPYKHARTFTEPNENEVFRTIQDEPPMNMYVLSTESDVTGAFVIPKLVIPLFPKAMSYPKTSNDLEKKLYRYGMSMGVAAIIYASREGKIDISPWYNLNEVNDEQGKVVGYSAQFIAAEADKLDKNDAFINKINNSISTCFAVLASREPADAVIARNAWVDILNNKIRWAQLFNPIFNYIVSKFDVKGTLDESARANMADDIRAKIGRLIFNIKLGSIDYTLPDVADGLVVKSVRPYNPVNTSNTGRLRKTGGIEGTVTESGNMLITYAKGRVRHVTEGNGSIDSEGNKYVVSFGNSGLGSAEVSESELDTWEPKRLVIAPDSDNRTGQYSLWVGMQFCSLMSDEGAESTERYPTDFIKSSNDVYYDDASYSGTLNSDNTPREATKALQDLHITTGPAIRSVRDLSTEVERIDKTSDFAEVMNILNTALLTCPAHTRDEINSHCTIDAIIAKGNNNLASANDIIATLVDAIYRDYTGDIGNDEAFLSMTKIMEYCGDTDADEMTKLMRAFSALNALTKVSYTDPETNRPVFVGDKPFTVSCEGDKVIIDEPDTRINYVDRYPVIHNNLARLATNTRNLISSHIERLDGMPDEVNYYYRRAMLALSTLSESYKRLITGDLDFYRERGDKMYDTIINLLNDDVKNTLAEYIGLIKRYVGKVPELSSRTIFDIHAGIPAALDMDAGMNKFKQAPGEFKFNETRGHSSGTRVYGDDAAGVPGMDIDTLAEKDVIGAHPMFDNLKHEMDEFDADNADTYSEVTNYPMLGMIKVDKYGMRSGSDNFNITSGLSPVEFERVAIALDDAHNYIQDADDGVRGKNIPIRELIKHKSGFIYMFINLMYPFMASSKPIARRNVLEEATKLATALLNEAPACLDDAIREEVNECATMFNDALVQLEKQIPEMTTSKVEAQTIAARTLSTALGNIVLYLRSLNIPESVPGNYGGMEQYGPAETGRLPVGNAGLYTTLSSMPPVSDNDNGSARMQSEETKRLNQLVNARMGVGNNGDTRLVRTLSDFYQLVGRGNTAGFNEAIIPYFDLLDKLSKKEDMTYRNIYTGQAKSTLGAAIVWAIVTDEGMGGTDYPTLTAMLDALCSPNLQPVEVPVFLVKGIRMQKDEMGKDRLDIDRLVPVLFTSNGKAVSAEGGIENIPPADLDQCTSFGDMATLWKSLNLQGGEEALPVETPTTPEEFAKDVRICIIADKFDNGEIVANLRRDKQDVNSSVYEDVIAKTRAELIKNAAKTKSSGADFVPFSILYACIDEKYLTAATANVTGASVDYINRKQGNTFYNEMSRTLNGGVTEAPMVDTIKKYETYIVYTLATAIAREAEGTLDEDSRDVILNMQTPDPEHPDRNVPDSSMNVLLGNNAGRVLDDCINAVRGRLTPDMTHQDYIKLAKEFLNSAFFADPAADKREIVKTLVDMVLHAKDAGQGIDKNAGLDRITALVGAHNNTIAEKLYNDYLERLKASGNPEKAAALPKQVLVNTAIRVVANASESKSEFRNIYRAGHGSVMGDIQQARLDTHALPPVPAYEKLVGTDGIDVMYRQTYNALIGMMSPSTAADYLDAVRYSIENLYGENAIDRFNELSNTLVTDIRDLVASTCDGIGDALDNIDKALNMIENPDAERTEDDLIPGVGDITAMPELANGDVNTVVARVVSLRSPDGTEPTSPNAIGVNSHGQTDPCNRSNAGMERIRTLNTLLRDRDNIKTVLKIDKPKGKVTNPDAAGTGAWYNNGINNLVSYFINKFCTWSVPVNSQKTPAADEDTVGRLVDTLTDIQEKLEARLDELSDDKTLDTMDFLIKKQLALVFASTPAMYSKGVATLANVASNFRGVSSGFTMPDAKLDAFLEKLCTKPTSGVRKPDSDEAPGDYEINGMLYSRGECFSIIRDAIKMYAKSHDMSAEEFENLSFMNPTFYECIRRCSSLKKDYALTSHAIMTIFMQHMIKHGSFKMSDAIPNHLTWYVTCPVPGLKNVKNRSRFEVPFSVVDDVVSECVRNSTLTASANQWEQFAEDFEKYSAAGNYTRNKEIDIPALRNDLVNLFKSVNSKLYNRMKAAFNEAYQNGLKPDNPVTTSEGIIVSANGAGLRDLLDIKDIKNYSPGAGELSYNPNLPLHRPLRHINGTVKNLPNVDDDDMEEENVNPDVTPDKIPPEPEEGNETPDDEV